ncbi:hypothetical protein Poli38472_013702 [Pythium oligandrum]|uniref:Lipase-like C-terminal domain-containing protein n=1 Tax=Pythium oligandrum TaxID=41045 RepID=A0A8K1CD69_PYTOL|nr:hypothetical protein Poli38472_013702 [Pythium oligandrum]|eukprot:TMW61239.1 hypothetical protein Poli38472_013702 [Pythium oligandrum]
MKKLFTSFVAALALVFVVGSSLVSAANKYPIVLVHGCGGWGPGDFFNIPYWGSLQGDFISKLKAEGHEVYAVGVGKFSSDWDRAVEIYAQLKGGRVDYGANHAAKHGHERYGRTYPGLFPKWGEVIDGQLQKVHLIGHSQGGTTIRMLAQLLNTGTKGVEIQEDPNGHPLWAGGKDWVHSITGLSAPFQGSTLTEYVKPGLEGVETFVATVAAIYGIVGDLDATFYDPVMDQWGIAKKQPNESFKDYFKRLPTSKLYQPGVEDNSATSLSIDGAKKQNSWIKTLPQVYHYTFVSEATFNFRDFKLRKIALPNPTVTNPVMLPLATMLGSHDTVKRGFSEAWLANDGFVPTIAQLGDGVAPVINFDGKSVRGQWVRFKTMTLDHWGAIGANPLQKVYSMYSAHAKLLADLPSHEKPNGRMLSDDSNAGNVTESDVDVHEAPSDIIQAIIDAQKELLPPADLPPEVQDP